MKYFRLTLLLCILFSSSLDLLTTLLCINHGAVELNPRARAILDRSPVLFIILKSVIPPLYFLGVYYIYQKLPLRMRRIIEYFFIIYLAVFILIVLNNLIVLLSISF